ncbi:type II-A CRISPR-associated protein Csn2 [Streptococcus porcinus]
MNLNLPILDQPLSFDSHTILAIENVSLYATFIKYFYQYTETSDLKLFDNKLRGLKESELMIITDVLGYDINTPPLLKMIHADLEEQLNEKPEIKSMVDKLAMTITELVAFECLENELDLEYDEITVLELIKALGVKVETKSDTIFEKCLEILQIFKYLNKKKLLVFINCGSYLSQKELKQLFEYIDLSQECVLFLEPRQLYDFPQYILDDDFFLLNYNMV